MSKIMTLSDLKKDDEYLSIHDYNREKSLYQKKINSLNNHIIDLSQEAFKNKDMIHLLKSQLKELYTKQTQQEQQLQIKIHKPTESDESIFKRMNDHLMNSLKLTDQQKADIRKQNEKEIEDFIKECKT
jgi:hypothetical protein